MYPIKSIVFSQCLYSVIVYKIRKSIIPNPALFFESGPNFATKLLYDNINNK